MVRLSLKEMPGLDSLPARDVYQMRPEYKKWDYMNFTQSLKRKRKKIAADYKHMQIDRAAYCHDIALLSTLRGGDNPTKIPWHWSAAKTLLEKDIKEGKNKEMTAAELYSTRAEYHAFSLKVFWDQIYRKAESR
jgi:hypothetical protein